jgi:hypothetical protein
MGMAVAKDSWGIASKLGSFRQVLNPLNAYTIPRDVAVGIVSKYFVVPVVVKGGELSSRAISVLTGKKHRSLSARAADAMLGKVFDGAVSAAADKAEKYYVKGSPLGQLVGWGMRKVGGLFKDSATEGIADRLAPLFEKAGVYSTDLLARRVLTRMVDGVTASAVAYYTELLKASFPLVELDDELKKYEKAARALAIGAGAAAVIESGMAVKYAYGRLIGVENRLKLITPKEVQEQLTALNGKLGPCGGKLAKIGFAVVIERLRTHILQSQGEFFLRAFDSILCDDANLVLVQKLFS